MSLGVVWQTTPEDYVVQMTMVDRRHFTCGNPSDIIQLVGITLDGKLSP